MNYLRLASGENFYYGEVNNSITLIDVAAHLSKINRFAGATHEFYSVAQHSVIVAKILKDMGHSIKLQRKGFLHDAHEMVTSDIPTPFHRDVNARIFKRFGEHYDPIEEAKLEIDTNIYAQFGIDGPTEFEKKLIKLADIKAFVTEASQLLKPTPEWIHDYGVAPAEYFIIAHPPEEAFSDFTGYYHKLFGPAAAAA